jgi:transposase-like protein
MTPTTLHDELQKLFADADLARDYLERLRWANGVICPHCGVKDQATKLQPKEGSKRPARKGVYKCKACRKQFTVTVGTIFEDSKIPLNKWMHVYHLVCSSKKGISSHQIHRMIGVSYKSAWFMVHRIRYSMTSGSIEKLSGIVEVDETYVGGKTTGKHKRGRNTDQKTPVVVVVRRNGESRAVKMPRVTGANLNAFIRKNVDKDARIMTDGYAGYNKVGEVYQHQTVDHHSGEYVRGIVHTNTAESWFALLKRGIVGSFHHVSEKHLDRYATEFAFRWNYRKTTDYERTIAAIKVVGGKRLMYKDLIAKK